MTLGQLEAVHRYVWMYVIKFAERDQGKLMLKIPSEAWDVEVECIYPTTYTFAEGSAAANVKACLAVIVNANQWRKAIGNA